MKKIMCAYIRGYIIKNNLDVRKDLLSKELDLLSSNDILEIENIGKSLGLKLYYFKEKELLPRVSFVLGFLKNIKPRTLLDVGSGRGVFLFSFLKEFTDCLLTSIDILDKRVEFIELIKLGGMQNLNVSKNDICAYKSGDFTFDVVTLLEVLEHIPNVEEAIANAVKLTNKFIIVSVPSKEDDNPEHIHLLTKDKLTNMFNKCGVTNLKFNYVNNHLLLIARKG